MRKPLSEHLDSKNQKPFKVGSPVDRAQMMQLIVARVVMLDTDRHLLSIRRSLNSMSRHIGKAGREEWTPQAAKQILAGISKHYKKTAGYVQECRNTLVQGSQFLPIDLKE